MEESQRWDAGVASAQAVLPCPCACGQGSRPRRLSALPVLVWPQLSQEVPCVSIGVHPFGQPAVATPRVPGCLPGTKHWGTGILH